MNQNNKIKQLFEDERLKGIVLGMSGSENMTIVLKDTTIIIENFNEKTIDQIVDEIIKGDSNE